MILGARKSLHLFEIFPDLVGQSSKLGATTSWPQGTGAGRGAEVPTPNATASSARSQVAGGRPRSDFDVCFLHADPDSSSATVWGSRIWLGNCETLVFADGECHASRPVLRTGSVLKNGYSRLRVEVVPNADTPRRCAVRIAGRPICGPGTDAGDPPRARAVAVLDHLTRAGDDPPRRREGQSTSE